MAPRPLSVDIVRFRFEGIEFVQSFEKSCLTRLVLSNNNRDVVYIDPARVEDRTIIKDFESL
jgi:hypothetical protein